MARLKNCKTCGNIVASDAGICPHCGAKQKKSGCAILAILLLIFVIMPTCMRYRDVPAEKTAPSHPAEKEKTAQIKKMEFNDTVAISFARTKLQECLDVKTDMRIIGQGKVTKLPPTVRKTFKFDGELYEVKQNFQILNVYNVWIKNEYRAVVEFLPEKGYRTVLLQVNGEQIFPPME